jgi:hypothetical protein
MQNRMGRQVLRRRLKPAATKKRVGWEPTQRGVGVKIASSSSFPCPFTSFGASARDKSRNDSGEVSFAS